MHHSHTEVSCSEHNNDHQATHKSIETYKHHLFVCYFTFSLSVVAVLYIVTIHFISGKFSRNVLWCMYFCRKLLTDFMLCTCSTMHADVSSSHTEHCFPKHKNFSSYLPHPTLAYNYGILLISIVTQSLPCPAHPTHTHPSFLHAAPSPFPLNTCICQRVTVSYGQMWWSASEWIKASLLVQNIVESLYFYTVTKKSVISNVVNVIPMLI